MNHYLLIALSLLFANGMGLHTAAADSASFAKVSATPRVENLIKQLSLEEKLTLIGGGGFATHAIERLGIPALEMTDGPVGVRAGNGLTAWPAGIALAATFDPALVGSMARELGEEARAEQKRLLLGPTINITRTPWGGRVFESYGEDPYLSGKLAAAYVTGLQSMGVGASVKHFALNNQEWARDHIDVQVSERALREIYWPAFAAAVNAGAVSVMAAYNKVNGVYCSENAPLLQTFLKQELGFKGFVLSDWVGTHSTFAAFENGLDLEMPSPVYFNTELLQALQTGQASTALLDDKVTRILNALERLGLLDKSEPPASFARAHPQTALKVAQESIVLLKNTNGLLPLSMHKHASIAIVGPSAARPRTGGGGSSFVPDPQAISVLAGLKQRIAEAGSVMELQVDTAMSLAGDGISKSEIITAPIHAEYFNTPTLAGPVAYAQDYPTLDFDWEWRAPHAEVKENQFSVRWTTAITPRYTGEHIFHLAYTPAARVYLDDQLIYDHWDVDANQAQFVDDSLLKTLKAGQTYRLRVEYHKSNGLASMQFEVNEPNNSAPIGKTGKVQSREAKLHQADAALVFVGQSIKTESESFDRTSLRLSQAQEALILATAKANPNTVVVVQAGGPIDMSAWASKVRAIVYAWYPGGQGGLAVADVLFGTVNPSGRLPISFPKTWEDSPVAAIYPGVDGVANYTDDVFVGYRYFDLHPHQQAYRFGYGLSYTQFVSKITQVRGLNNTVSRPEIEVRAQVKNTGSRAGNTLVQLYVGASHATLLRPVQELKAFKKVFLQPGQTSEVLFTLDAQAFRYFDEQSHQWLVAPGAYQLNLFSATAQPESKKTIKLVAE